MCIKLVAARAPEAVEAYRPEVRCVRTCVCMEAGMHVRP